MFWTLFFFIIDPTEFLVSSSKVQYYAARAELKKKLQVNRGFDVSELLEGEKGENEYIFQCIIDIVYLDTE